MLSELPYVAFLAAVLVVVPLPWHWRSRNVATLSLIAWLFVVNVIYGVDSIIWHNNVIVVVPVWCDITTKIIIGAQMALPAACMCICIHLEQVPSGRQVRTLKSEKQRRQIIEAVLCFLMPMIWMALHYTVQGHRFDIIESYGCRPNTYVSIPAILIIWVPPLVLATITLGFAAVAFHHFLRRRFAFAKHLVNSNSGLSISRYFRLMLMSLFLMVMGVASTSITLWYSSSNIRPWTGWASVHSNFSRIAQYPLVFVSPEMLRYYYVIWMIIPVSSFVFFLFFAFGRDALQDYAAVITRLHRCVTKCRARATVGKDPTPIPSARNPITITISAARSGSISYNTPSTPIKGRDIDANSSNVPNHDDTFANPPNLLPDYERIVSIPCASRATMHHSIFGEKDTLTPDESV